MKETNEDDLLKKLSWVMNERHENYKTYREIKLSDDRIETALLFKNKTKDIERRLELEPFAVADILKAKIDALDDFIDDYLTELENIRKVQRKEL